MTRLSVIYRTSLSLLTDLYEITMAYGYWRLAALKSDNGAWQPRVKLSEQAIKTPTPGILQVRRYRNASGAVADMI